MITTKALTETLPVRCKRALLGANSWYYQTTSTCTMTIATVIGAQVCTQSACPQVQHSQVLQHKTWRIREMEDVTKSVPLQYSPDKSSSYIDGTFARCMLLALPVVPVKALPAILSIQFAYWALPTSTDIIAHDLYHQHQHTLAITRCMVYSAALMYVNIQAFQKRSNSKSLPQWAKSTHLTRPHPTLPVCNANIQGLGHSEHITWDDGASMQHQ